MLCFCVYFKMQLINRIKNVFKYVKLPQMSQISFFDILLTFFWIIIKNKWINQHDFNLELAQIYKFSKS